MSVQRAELVFHPLRMRLLQHLLRSGPRTASEILDELDAVAPATLYRHLNKLADAGVIDVVEERPVRGVVERVYDVGSAGGGSFSADDLRAASREDHLRFFSVFLAGVLGEFERYLERGSGDFAADGAGYRQFPLHLTDQEFADLQQSLDRQLAAAVKKKPRPGSRRRVLTRIILPSGEQ